jgi:hypothetical protein
LVNSYIERLRVAPLLTANGPAIWGGCVTRRSIRSRSRYFSHKAVTVQGGYGVVFANPGTSFIEAGILSRYRMFFRGTCAVSRYKFDRSQKTVTVQDLYCGQVRASGCKFQQDLSWEQGAAKTITNNLPILSVLGGRSILLFSQNRAVILCDFLLKN